MPHDRPPLAFVHSPQEPRHGSPTKETTRMPKYMIERTVPGAGQMDAAALAAIAQKSNQVLRDLGPDVQWVHSYVTDDKITCVYVALNADIILEHARCGGFPADSVMEVRATIDPTTAEVATVSV